MVALIQLVPEPAISAVDFDTFYFTLRLLLYLRKALGIMPLGTFGSNRIAVAKNYYLMTSGK